MPDEIDSNVLELRFVITTPAYEDAVGFYRDTLGLTELADWSGEHGRGLLLDAGKATVEILDDEHAAFVDSLEVGERVAGPVRVAFKVHDAIETTRNLADGGATVLGEPRVTPFGSVNARVEPPVGVQLTIFSE